MGAVASVTTATEQSFCGERLVRVFNRCFALSHRTRLQGGAAEPLYQPAENEAGQHVIYFREDYFASALHEIAHWCIAGEQRRRQVDFGYWYAPEGRNPAQQRAFENVEYRPQALEWFFSRACGYRFRISVDNLDLETGQMPDTTDFRQRVLDQARYWQETGLPARAANFYRALCAEFGTSLDAHEQCFTLADLD